MRTFEECTKFAIGRKCNTTNGLDTYASISNRLQDIQERRVVARNVEDTFVQQVLANASTGVGGSHAAGFSQSQHNCDLPDLSFNGWDAFAVPEAGVATQGESAAVVRAWQQALSRATPDERQMSLT